MKIESTEIYIKDLVDGYEDNAENGVLGYHKKLDIRPPYQREFVYKDKQSIAVIDTVLRGFPLNSIYWVKNDGDRYEVLDGQQRIISICRYINNVFCVEHKFFSNLPSDIKEKILNYKLNVYMCEGTDSEKLNWFKTINIAGVTLTPQELRNAVYKGPWVVSAKSIFSKNNCAAYNLGGSYLKGSPIRQEFLESAIKWISYGNIEKYMAEHQHDRDADELWQYFQDVVRWIEKLFFNYRREMKGLEWGFLYNKYKDNKYNSNELEAKIEEYMEDDEVTNPKGIYEFLLSGNEKFLNLRTFTDKQKREYFEKHKFKNKDGVYVCKCARCKKKELTLDQCEADHIIPWSKGGKTTDDNLQLLCKICNAIKSDN